MDKASLLEFIRSHSLAVQSTVSPDATPQAAVVGFAITDQLEIVFDTLLSTRKATNLRMNAKVAFVMGGLQSGDERTVQIEGVADRPSGEELKRLTGAYYEKHPDGPRRLSWPGLIYIRVRPNWIRYSDFNCDPPRIIEWRETDLEAWSSKGGDCG